MLEKWKTDLHSRQRGGAADFGQIGFGQRVAPVERQHAVNVVVGLGQLPHLSLVGQGRVAVDSGQHFDGCVDRGGVRLDLRTIAGVDLEFRLGIGRGGDLDIFGNVDDDRAGATGGGDMERLMNDLGQLGGSLHQIIMLGAVARDADRVGFLKGVDFFWTTQHLWQETLVVGGIVLAIFLMIDLYMHHKEGRFAKIKDPTPDSPLKLHGKINLLLIAVIIGAISASVLMPILPTIDQHIGQPIALALADIHEILRKLLVAILSALFMVAAFDLAYVRLEFNKRMRMTKQEIKDEYKQTEGDPHVKARLRQLRIEKGRKRMIQAVPSADVVITNPTHYAIALKYDPDTMDAPQLVAKGVDAFALRIREVATEHGVTIVENPPLARSLWASVDVDETIPADLYKAVAEVISYVFRTKGRLPRR